MSNTMKDFITLCLAGEVDVSEIDDFIERWHNSDDPRELHDYLGMSTDEYAAWVAKPEALACILYSRKYGITLEAAVQKISLTVNNADTREDTV